MHRIWLMTTLVGFVFTLAVAAEPLPRVVSLRSPSALLKIRVMVKAGSAMDPEGLEGLAYLTGRLLIDGGFGDPRQPVTKDRLAEITRPWGSGALPQVVVSKETTTFSMTVPREVLDRYVREVLAPMFRRPLFAERELERVRAEALQELQSLRFEQIELVGLVAMDTVIHAGTSYAHPVIGTAQGLRQVTPEAVRRFYATYYRPDNVIVGVSSDDPAVVRRLEAVWQEPSSVQADPLPPRPVEPPPPPRGRDVLIIALPSALSTGLHAGFPIPVTRAHPDYWPLYVANVWFGTHRDSFSHLYQVIREERGYNYGDYSYIEHFEGRPFFLFPPTNTPRRYQYFSIWIRPVAHDYAVHIMKALTWELEHFIRTGLTAEQCELAKNKARVLHLNLAETIDRMLGYRLDDLFYGLSPGYLDAYLARVEAVTCDQVNAAIRKYLQARDLKYVVVTDAAVAPRLVEAIAHNGPVWGKKPEDYQIPVREEGGRKVYMVPADKLPTLQRDAAWAYYWLDIPRERIRIVPAAQLFETADRPAP